MLLNLRPSGHKSSAEYKQTPNDENHDDESPTANTVHPTRPLESCVLERPPRLPVEPSHITTSIDMESQT